MAMTARRGSPVTLAIGLTMIVLAFFLPAVVKDKTEPVTIIPSGTTLNVADNQLGLWELHWEGPANVTPVRLGTASLQVTGASSPRPLETNQPTIGFTDTQDGVVTRFLESVEITEPGTYSVRIVPRGDTDVSVGRFVLEGPEVVRSGVGLLSIALGIGGVVLLLLWAWEWLQVQRDRVKVDEHENRTF